MTNTKTPSKRLYFLDNLKIFLTILVILHHVGQAYGPTGGFWQYKSSLHENIPWLSLFFPVNAAFFMGLFFMIAGYFLPSSYDRKNNMTFLKDKLIRLGIPTLLGFLVISPLEMYFYYINYSRNKPLNFSEYFMNIYLGIGGKPFWYKTNTGVPFPELNFGHLWFVENLLVFTILYFIVRKLILKNTIKDDSKTFNFTSILIIGFLIALASVIIRIWYPIDKWIALFGFMQSEIAHLPQYIILFIIGIIAYRKNWFIKISKKAGYLSLGLEIIMAFIVYTAHLIPHTADILFSKWDIYEAFLCVFLCFGLIVLFREKLNLSTSKFKFLAANSYLAYIFHFPIVLTVQYSFDKVTMGGAIGKFLIVSFLSVVITYFVAAIISKIMRSNNVLEH